MKLTEFCLNNRVTTLVLTGVVVGAGFATFRTMGRLEDPEFTIKEALVITPYPGATAEEVEQEVTDKIEIAVQRLGQLKEVKSLSMRGLSIVQPKMKDKYDKASLPQVWDELRRKVGEAQSQLPPGAGPSVVNDDFGDVFGIFGAVYGDGYSYRELYDVAKLLRRELLLVKDVAKVEFLGQQPEAVYVELDRERMARLGVPAEAVFQELQARNVVAPAGRVPAGTDFGPMEVTSGITEVADLGNVLIRGLPGGAQIRLRDVADVRRGYKEPAQAILRFDGKPAIGIGISTAEGGNVVTMGDAVAERIRELSRSSIPAGMGIGVISLQSTTVQQSIRGFAVSLLEAVVIVIVTLLLFMGLRSGLIIGFVLFLTIAGSFVFMPSMGVLLERISLGALIIALGMLVDNAIVVVDGLLVRIQQGEDRERAAVAVVKQNAWPLLGATIIAVLAFAAIGTSKDATGEFTRSLFSVIMISLLFSWLIAVTVTPLLGVMFLPGPKPGVEQKDPYGGRFYVVFRRIVGVALRRRVLTMGIVLAGFAVALVGFGKVRKSFFPPSTRPQFMVDFWLPQGTAIEETDREAEAIRQWIAEREGVTHVATVVGQGSLRFLLTYTPEKANTSFAQLLVEVDNPKRIAAVSDSIQDYLEAEYPQSIPQYRLFILGPGDPGKVQAKFFGPDPEVLHRLTAQAESIISAQPDAYGVRNEWRYPVRVVRAVLADEQATMNGIRQQDVAAVLQRAFEGQTVGVYREADELLPIVARAPDAERLDAASIENLQIWSPVAQRNVPLRQVVSRFETALEHPIIWRTNRKRAMTVLADPAKGEGSQLLAAVRPAIEAIPRPPGYDLEWWGEYRNQANAQGPLLKATPIFMMIMFLITLALFNNTRKALAIWINVPLALMGVTLGLLLLGQPFGFMALLGFLSLSGMIIKNGIVLVDEINARTGEGATLHDAILDSAVRRLRPVAMAAATTILGVAPLFPDPFFSAMGVTIAFGLAFATVLTMIVLPTSYAILFRVKEEAQK
jgi:multidrug efflux pump subunit AcrB